MANEKIIRERSKVILKKIKQLAPEAKTICDVGSGFGFFLHEAKKQGYTSIGIEPSKQLASNQEKRYDIPSFVGTLGEYLQVDQRGFDVVTCIHVIEHVQNPKQFISLLVQLVKPGGLLYLETPNSDGHLLYAEKGEYTFLIPPEHLWLFSQESIKNLLPPRTEIEYTNTYSYSEHFMGILKSIIHPPQDLKSSVKNIKRSTSKKEKHRIIKKRLSYYVFDKVLAPLCTPFLNLYRKGSILELYIKK